MRPGGLRASGADFGGPRSEFLDKYFADRQKLLDRAVTHESYQRIVDDLRHPGQQAIVAAPADRNALVLAGPGAGKTRVIVHRVAFLVNILRVPPRQVLVLCFNRLAALQLKRRLRELIGAAGTRVTVLTYHALAARLTGTSFAERPGGTQATAAAGADGDRAPDLAGLIPAATRILRGEQPVAGLAEDEVRERLLAGYRYVLVDEYQDIDEEQYQLISAVTDRTSREADTKLAILAVGDDDQNIYAFRGANVAYIRRFQEDYQAQLHFLLENYRSTGHILAAANQLIAHNRDRMKTGQAIRIHTLRERQPSGGDWEALDPAGRGRVQVLALTDGQNEASAVVAELQRLQSLKPDLDWSACAVLARTRDALQPIRAACEQLQIPVIWGLEGERLPRLTRIREIARFLDYWDAHRDQDGRASELLPTADAAVCQTTQAEHCRPAEQLSAGVSGDPWRELLDSLLAQWQDETDNCVLPVAEALDFVYDSLAEQRREQRVGRGVFLATVHAAKGTEFDHVLVPGTGWTGAADRERQEEERRLYYVALTRARQTLTLLAAHPDRHLHVKLLSGEFLVQRLAGQSAHVPPDVLAQRYELLAPEDVDLGFAGARPAGHPIHTALAELQPGSELQFVARGESIELLDAFGRPVVRLSQAACRRWRSRLGTVRRIRVTALVQRRRVDEQAEFRQRCRCERWEIPLAEVIWLPRDND